MERYCSIAVGWEGTVEGGYSSTYVRTVLPRTLEEEIASGCLTIFIVAKADRDNLASISILTQSRYAACKSQRRIAV